MSNDEDDYKVGRGKPPKQSRFQKGQSGNPRGRPKGARNVDSILTEVGKRKVRVKDGDGRTRTVELTRVIAESALQKGAQAGASIRDKLHLLDSIERAQTKSEEARKVQRAERELTQAEENALDRYIQRLKDTDFG